jgi:hypothetical protein
MRVYAFATDAPTGVVTTIGEDPAVPAGMASVIDVDEFTGRE